MFLTKNDKSTEYSCELKIIIKILTVLRLEKCPKEIFINSLKKLIPILKIF